jgi:adenylyltransferase/sulfurtransferase
MTILPGETACLACLMSDIPPPGTTPTCDTAGILGSVIGVIASLEACEAIKILSGNADAINRSLSINELWDKRLRQVDVSRLRDQGDCRVCRHGEFHWLSGERCGGPAVLCGRNAVQIAAPAGTVLSLEELASRLAGVGKVTRNSFLLRLAVDEYLLTVFPDGRTIVGGTDDVTVARSLQAKYVGS